MDRLTNLLNHKPEITFTRRVYRKHTNMYFDKKQYQFKNNKIVFDVDDDDISIIQKMWITMPENIKNIAVFLVDINFDINDVTFDTESTGVNRVQFGAHDRNLENVTEVISIYKFSNKSFDFFNNVARHSIEYNMFEHGIVLASKNQHRDIYGVLPHENMWMVPKIINKNGMKLLVMIDTFDTTIEHSLVAKHMIINHQDEHNQIMHLPAEYLIKTYETKMHNLICGENTIVFDFLRHPMAFFVIIAEKNSNLDITASYTIASRLGDTEKIITKKLDLVDNDPEFCNFTLPNYDIYVLSAMRLSIDFQPEGNTIMKDGSTLTIKSGTDTSIEILYCLYDCLKYSNNEQFPDVHLFSKTQFFEQPEPEPVLDNLPQPGPDLNNPPELEHYLDRIRIPKSMKLICFYHKLALNILKFIEMTTVKFRSLPIDNECLISFDTIAFGELYYKCENCNKTVKKKELTSWMLSDNFSHKCCNCQKCMDAFPQLYVNINPFYVLYLGLFCLVGFLFLNIKHIYFDSGFSLMF